MKFERMFGYCNHVTINKLIKNRIKLGVTLCKS